MLFRTLYSIPRRYQPIERAQRINDQIRISPVRVISAEGEQLGIIPTEEALKMAQDLDLDLVEVAPNGVPPVCRVMDFGKFKYEQKKKQNKSSKQHQTQLKEIRVRPRTDSHDVEVKLNRARQFLGNKDKVIISMQFRGRELAHVDRGLELVKTMIQQLEEIAKIEREPVKEGRRVIAILAPR
ncbi:MAG: translation initiation factor IF-3 [Planctomycetota bacterium]|mgnify:CR=1 FL=1|nr:translation initiation factor IF-3 [Planctomycetota bacterium]